MVGKYIFRRFFSVGGTLSVESLLKRWTVSCLFDVGSYCTMTPILSACCQGPALCMWRFAMFISLLVVLCLTYISFCACMVLYCPRHRDLGGI